MQSNKDENLIIDLTFEFSLSIIRYAELLENDRRYVIAGQLLRSGTSIGANSREAQNAESKPDFIHKFKIAAKEADETAYWLLLCKNAYNHEICDELIEKCDSIIRVLSKIIASSKSKSIS